jgi:hypothetical protein
MARAALAPDSTDRRVVRLSTEDNVVVAAGALVAGALVAIDGRQLVLRQAIATGHKIAVRPIAAGEKVFKYGAPIGSATRAIEPGEHVHTHNLRSDYLPTYTLEKGQSFLADAEGAR